MTKIVRTLAIPLAIFACSGYGAESETILSPNAIADSMRQARHSDGFEARMNVSIIRPDGRRSAPFKLAVIGRFNAETKRLLIRGISPDRVRNRFVVAERSADGRVRAISYGEHLADGTAKADPFEKLFDSGLVIWDMFTPWWDWPKQSLGETDQVAGHDCRSVRSQTDSDNALVREVISCVDTDQRLSLRTQLFDDRHTLVRTIVVEQTLRKASAVMAAKKMSITGADNGVTEVEVYGGDEHYVLDSDTFAALDAHSAAGR
jgi:hypothetical protein